MLEEEYHESGRLKLKKSWDDNGIRMGTWIDNYFEDERLVIVRYYQKEGRFVTEYWKEKKITETTCYERNGNDRCEVPSGRSYRNGEEPYF